MKSPPQKNVFSSVPACQPVKFPLFFCHLNMAHFLWPACQTAKFPFSLTSVPMPIIFQKNLPGSSAVEVFLSLSAVMVFMETSLLVVFMATSFLMVFMATSSWFSWSSATLGWNRNCRMNRSFSVWHSALQKWEEYRLVRFSVWHSALQQWEEYCLVEGAKKR